MQELRRMTMRPCKSLMALLAALMLAALAPLPLSAQNAFEAVIKVNDQAITRYEIEQRARMLQLFRSPGNLPELAREQLIEDRLKLSAARASGVVLSEEDVEAGVEEFAGRANMTGEQLIRALEGAGVGASTLRDFVRVGITWRELNRARFSSRVSVTEDDLDRAKAAISGSSSSVRVLLSEIIMPAPPSQAMAVQERASRISQVTTEAEFSAQARRYSASRTRARGGRMDWVPLTQLPPALRPIILGLAPGEVTDPLPLEGAVALFQLRDIEEVDAPEPEYAAIEYAAYYIPGGRSDAALATARQIEDNTDTCDDLYGTALGQPEEVLERTSLAPAEIPQDIAIELAKLDPGEVSATLTRNNGQTLMLLMLCGRSPLLEGEGPTDQDLTLFITNRRLDSFANGYLEELKAEARIVILE
ncbi:peptidylprolyl isomerase [Roseovarius faecimaris]|uniref:Parvulin-like PPIase n=2 Tax=Roseovarius faecimaris TaxID=2494550 RepID=A0A6I6ISF8_9RHOB|nr:peptidylprolyl isomerase [Roseovarius faecimaris]